MFTALKSPPKKEFWFCSLITRQVMLDLRWGWGGGVEYHVLCKVSVIGIIQRWRRQCPCYHREYRPMQNWSFIEESTLNSEACTQWIMGILCDIYDTLQGKRGRNWGSKHKGDEGRVGSWFQEGKQDELRQRLGRALGVKNGKLFTEGTWWFDSVISFKYKR